MESALIAFIVFLSLIVLEWAYRHVRISRQQSSNSSLHPDMPGPPAEAPLVSVVVAAKDEEENIATCLETVLEQDYPNFEVIVANDRSTDRTAAIVQSFVERDSRVKLLNIEFLPDGWCGKNNAMQQAMEHARGEYLCMIDADCVQESPRTLSVSVQYAIDKRADLLSILPRHLMKSFWENIVQPVSSGVMMVWFSPDRVNDPKAPNAYANGAFMLMTRTAYDAVGQHAAVKGCVNEDIHMALCVKRAGLRLCVVPNEGLYKVRMYTSLSTIVRGWMRIFYGSFGSLGRLSASLALLVVMGFTPLLAMCLGLGLSLSSETTEPLLMALGILGTIGVAIQISVMYRFYKLAGARGELAWSFHLGYIVNMLILIWAIIKLRPGARVVWRDTHYTTPGSSS